MKYCLGLLTTELHFENSQSLKDRRRIMNSLKDRVRQRFNVSVMEANFGEKWQRGGLIVSCAGPTEAGVNEVFRSVVSLIEEDPRVMIISPQVRFYE